MVVDAAARTARVQPGATWGDVDLAAQRHGLATPAGVVSQTGVAGLTLGGGFGWLSRRWGLTADNVLSVRMVLADGRRVRASEQELPDLFWAIRGGGGNFGIVTEFELRLHELGTDVLAGALLYPADAHAGGARGVSRVHRRGTGRALGLRRDADRRRSLDWVPAALQGRPVIMLIPCHSGDLEAGEAALEPLRRAIPAMADVVARKPYLDHQVMFDGAAPHGWGYYWRSHYLPPLTDAAIDVITAFAWQKASDTSFSILFHLGGDIDTRSDADNAASGRGATHALNINASWPEGGPRHPDIGWCREYATAMQPHATGGVYLNFLHNDEGEARLRDAHGPRYARLEAAKTRFDPDNVFRSNQNIQPASQVG